MLRGIISLQAQKDIIDFRNDREKKKSLSFRLSGELYNASVALHSQRFGDSKLGYIILGSKDSVLLNIKAEQNKFIFIVLLVTILAIMISYFLVESFLTPINKFMEGMVEIINGNKKFRFNNDAEGIEGNLNQNANYMISVLLGEKIDSEQKSSISKKVEN